jgi:DNA-binding NtrC family response regulator
MKKIRILIIDDEPRWIDFAKSDLSNFDIVVIKNTKSALMKLKSKSFDLVIVSSRRLDTLELIKKKYADKPVLVTTVRPTTKEALSAYRLGASRYVTKSFRPQGLLEQVREVIPILQ